MDASPIKPLYIIVGLSGAGKSTALRVFEDHRFFAVDGLPAGVAPEVAAIMASGDMAHFSGLAIGLDIRQNGFLENFNKAFAILRERGLEPRLLFLEADDETLVRRYGATRRPHPLETSQVGLKTAIAAERQLLEEIREKANVIINTAAMNIHDLRHHLRQKILDSEHYKLKVGIVSFGFKHGIPQDADFVFDLRFLANPYFVETLREKSGLDQAVAEYVFASGPARQYLAHIENLLNFVLPEMARDDRFRVTIALGCTGGRHRSVAFAELLASRLAQLDFPLHLSHRDIDKN